MARHLPFSVTLTAALGLALCVSYPSVASTSMAVPGTAQISPMGQFASLALTAPAAVLLAQEDEDATANDGGLSAVEAWDREAIQGQAPYYNSETDQTVQLPYSADEGVPFDQGGQTYMSTDSGYQAYDGNGWQDMTPAPEPGLGETANSTASDE